MSSRSRLPTARKSRRTSSFPYAQGSWSHEMAARRLRNLRLPMQPGKGYSLTLENPPRLPKLCAILTEARVAMTPMGHRLRFGGTMEMSGLNHRDPIAKRVEGIIRLSMRCLLSGTERELISITSLPRCGLRPCSPDGLPYLGRTAGNIPNLGIATGHAMMGDQPGADHGKDHRPDHYR